MKKQKALVNRYSYNPEYLYTDFPVDTNYVFPSNFVEFVDDFVKHKLNIIKELDLLKQKLIEYKKKEFIELEDPKTGEVITKTRDKVYKGKELEASLYSTLVIQNENGEREEISDMLLPSKYKLDNKNKLKLSSYLFYASNNKFHNITRLSQIDTLKDQIIAQYDLNDSEGIITENTFIDDIIVNIPKYNIFNPYNMEEHIDGADLPEQDIQNTVTRRPLDSIFALPICVILQYLYQKDSWDNSIENLKKRIVQILKDTAFHENMINKKTKLSSLSEFKDLKQYESLMPPVSIQKQDYKIGIFILNLYQSYNKFVLLAKELESNNLYDSFETCARSISWLGLTAHTLINCSFVGKGGKTKTQHLKKAKNYIIRIYQEKFINSNKPIRKIAEEIRFMLFDDIKYLCLYPKYKENRETVESLNSVLYEPDNDRSRYIYTSIQSIVNIITDYKKGIENNI